MICYRDRTYCTYETCKKFSTCSCALTDKVKQDAKEWWGNDNAPICVYADFPSCYIIKE